MKLVTAIIRDTKYYETKAALLNENFSHLIPIECWGVVASSSSMMSRM